MPILNIRSPNEVPAASRSSKAARDEQKRYEEFIQAVGAEVGELELSEEERPRPVKVRLRRAETRLHKEVEIWDVNNKVYFRAAAPRRGRPRKDKG